MKAKIIGILKPQQSNINKGEYFVIKTETPDGKKYDIVPSNDCETYDSWMMIAELGVGTNLDGVEHLMTKGDKNFFNKKRLPNVVY